MRLTFVGAAQEVTGSCFLIETGDVSFLVDCGMFQGGRQARERNLKSWSLDPRQIDFVLLRHAHIDHSGLLPRLCALGFNGPIPTTRATADLLSVMLLDSMYAHTPQPPDGEGRYRNSKKRPPKIGGKPMVSTAVRFDFAPAWTRALQPKGTMS